MKRSTDVKDETTEQLRLGRQNNLMFNLYFAMFYNIATVIVLL